MSKLAILGGQRTVQTEPGNIFTWPIITKEIEDAVLEVLREGKMSHTDVTIKFEREYAKWHNVKYALGVNSGTAALHNAMWACGVGIGDEIISPSLTHWACAIPALNLGATVVFADVQPDTMCIDPKDIEHRVTKHTRAIVATHLYGYPCDMDPIMEIAKEHNIKVIEDASHAHGGLYKGRLVGTIGDVGCFSLMSGKPLPIGEAGILITNDRGIYERAIAFAHYERTGRRSPYFDVEEEIIIDPNLKKFAGLPLGGFKYRMHQLSSAVGRVQLRYYKERMKEIQKAMNYFWDLLEDVKGLRAHRLPKDSRSTMGGWWWPKAFFVPEELGNLPLERFYEAVKAEIGKVEIFGVFSPLHLHPLFHEADIYHHGKPTVIANADTDLRQGKGSLPITESMNTRCFGVPWFKHYKPEIIKEYAAAFRKVAENYEDLLP